jgi:hypothetical protein
VLFEAVVDKYILMSLDPRWLGLSILVFPFFFSYTLALHGYLSSLSYEWQRSHPCMVESDSLWQYA